MFKTFCSVMEKCCHATIGISETKGLFIPVNEVLAQEP